MNVNKFAIWGVQVGAHCVCFGVVIVTDFAIVGFAVGAAGQTGGGSGADWVCAGGALRMGYAMGALITAIASGAPRGSYWRCRSRARECVAASRFGEMSL